MDRLKEKEIRQQVLREELKQKNQKVKVLEWDYFGINEINICLEIEGQKFRGCLSESDN